MEQRRIETYAKVVQTGTPVLFEEYSSALGKWFETRAFRTARNQFATIFTDITEHKQAEEALRENRRQLTDIIEFLQDATRAIAKEGRVIIWNKAIEKMTGIPAAEMIGKCDYAYAIPFYGEARPQLMDLVFADREEIAARYPNITRQGNTVMAEVFCNALHNNEGAWVFAKASPDPMWIKDVSGRYVAANEMYFLADPSVNGDIVGKTDAECFPPEKRCMWATTVLPLREV